MFSWLGIESVFVNSFRIIFSSAGILGGGFVDSDWMSIEPPSQYLVVKRGSNFAIPQDMQEKYNHTLLKKVTFWESDKWKDQLKHSQNSKTKIII